MPQMLNEIHFYDSNEIQSPKACADVTKRKSFEKIIGMLEEKAFKESDVWK